MGPLWLPLCGSCWGKAFTECQALTMYSPVIANKLCWVPPTSYSPTRKSFHSSALSFWASRRSTNISYSARLLPWCLPWHPLQVKHTKALSSLTGSSAPPAPPPLYWGVRPSPGPPLYWGVRPSPGPVSHLPHHKPCRPIPLIPSAFPCRGGSEDPGN